MYHLYSSEKQKVYVENSVSKKKREKGCIPLYESYLLIYI